jgi:hypothetical protein
MAVLKDGKMYNKMDIIEIDKGKIMAPLIMIREYYY